jgi:hypothetical protein
MPHSTDLRFFILLNFFPQKNNHHAKQTAAVGIRKALTFTKAVCTKKNKPMFELYITRLVFVTHLLYE